MPQKIKALNNGRNPEFSVLSVFAIIFTVMGHAGVTFPTMEWLFPFDSFHMPLFVFISGYFFRYQSVSLHSTKKFLQKLVGRLLIPFFLWNLAYGIFTLVLSAIAGVPAFQPDEFLYILLVRPFVYGNCFFIFNDPSWFILALFEVKLFHWLLRLLFSKVKRKEIIITVLSLMLAVGAVTAARIAVRTPLVITITRALYLHLWFQVGILYRQFGEKHDNMNTVLYITLVFLSQLLLWLIVGDKGINAYIYNSEFVNCAGLTILAALNGIAFFLRIAKIVSRSIGNNKTVDYISRHTFSIMMHHILGFMVLKTLFWGIDSALHINEFNLNSFLTDMWYYYLPRGLSCFRMLYVLVGLFLPLCGCKLWDKIRSHMSLHNLATK